MVSYILTCYVQLVYLCTRMYAYVRVARAHACPCSSRVHVSLTCDVICVCLDDLMHWEQQLFNGSKSSDLEKLKQFDKPFDARI